MDTVYQLATMAFFVLIVLYNLVRFTLRRRCPSCKRFFGGKKSGSATISSSEQTGRVWDYKESSYHRETRSSATVRTSLTCKRCGFRWSYTTRHRRTRRH